MVEKINSATRSAAEGIQRGMDHFRKGAEQVQRASLRWREDGDVRISRRAQALNKAKEAAINDKRIEQRRGEDARAAELRERQDSVAQGMVEQRIGRYQTMANIESHRAADAMDREALEVARQRQRDSEER